MSLSSFCVVSNALRLNLCKVYGPKKVIGENGQFLHAKTLGFTHPRTGKFMEFECPLPDYYESFLNELREYEKSK